MSKTTAVVSVYTKGESQGGQTALAFGADYNDERNKEWAKYTPGLRVQMTVLDSVAEQFEQGGRYLLTFERAE
jgi:pimeloyl-ACP methyl ester carboxylesterase